MNRFLLSNLRVEEKGQSAARELTSLRVHVAQLPTPTGSLGKVIWPMYVLYTPSAKSATFQERSACAIRAKGDSAPFCIETEAISV
jgi:hypothetical protein